MLCRDRGDGGGEPMRGSSLDRRIMWLATALLLAAAGLAVLRPQLLDLLGEARPDPCSGSLELIADDGRRLKVVVRRCESPSGRFPALLVRAGHRTEAREWIGELPDWSRDGRGTWWLVPDSPPGWWESDLEAALRALADEPWADPGRVAVLLSGEAVASLPPSAAERRRLAAAWIVNAPAGTPPAGSGPETLVFEAGRPVEAGERVGSWLAERLRVDLRAGLR
jgi:hypothetical protein